MGSRLPSIEGEHAVIEELNIDQQRGVLNLRLSSGASPALSHAALRMACRCAPCEAGRRLGHPPVAEQSVRITGCEPIGQQALRFHFSDGHDRGIFPLVYLEELAGRGVDPYAEET
ncbi:MAG: DUF971 domain-containing protein [Aquabacterium sp.]|nr:MAG: DUF971 domain-containing protein [Aquabacterium sp.]